MMLTASDSCIVAGEPLRATYEYDISEVFRKILAMPL